MHDRGTDRLLADIAAHPADESKIDRLRGGYVRPNPFALNAAESARVESAKCRIFAQALRRIDDVKP
jgi:hypothetical protein